MASIIKQLFDRKGNAVFLKTREKAVYDDNNVRLDNKLFDISDKFNKYTPISKIANTQAELDNIINNVVPNGNHQWYRIVVNVTASLTLGGGIWYVEGYVTTNLYEWQSATSYAEFETREYVRSKYNGKWTPWQMKIADSRIVQTDTVGGVNYIPSAEVTKALGSEIDTVNNKLGDFNRYDIINSNNSPVSSITLTKSLQDGGVYLLVVKVPSSANTGNTTGLYMLDRQGTDLKSIPIVNSDKISSITFTNMIPVIQFNSSIYPTVILYRIG